MACISRVMVSVKIGVRIGSTVPVGRSRLNGAWLEYRYRQYVHSCLYENGQGEGVQVPILYTQRCCYM